MKRVINLFPANMRTGMSVLLFSILFFSTSVFASQPTLHVIYFGGTVGRNYSLSETAVVPVNHFNVEVGDTIVWSGNFNSSTGGYPLDSLIFPADAPTFSPITSGNTFTYVIEAAGDYYFANKNWAQLGMKGSIIAAFLPHGSLTNAGRDFLLGAIYSSYNNIAIPSSLVREYVVYALISTYYDNVIYVSYYDAAGNELPPTRYIVAAHQRLQVILDLTKMRLDSNVETPSYRACHITSKNPITVEYLSRGANAGGGYLALPTLAVGKKYVVASYNDDAGQGAIPKGNGIPSPDQAGGTFMIIATQDGTAISITPTTKTSGGHTSGFVTSLSKGQCYLVRSDGLDASHDLSGTIIEASRPIIVISGHEDAFIGDGSNANAEQRDMMIEQLTPVEYWDSAGYVSIPLKGTVQSSSTGGIGDTYRVYTYDPGIAKVQADVGGFGSYDMSTSRLGYAEHLDITGATDIYSTNGHNISVMQYDERSQGSQKPFPAPSMMTIVPHSRWRNTYNFAEFDPVGISGVNPNQYVAVIADSLNTIKVSVDGGPDGPITNLGSQVSTYNKITSRYGHAISGVNYEVGSHIFYLHSDYPFMCYSYGMSQISFGFSNWGNYDFNFEYANPGGMQLNTGVPPSFKVRVDEHSDCSGWHVCVRDTGTKNPGVKAVMLVNDTAAVYFLRPGVKFQNASLDSTSADFTAGELHPFMESTQEYCFDVRIDNRLAESKAPIGIIDNNGNGLLIQLHRSAPTFKLTSRPGVQNPNSIVFTSQKVGVIVYDTIVVHNTAPSGGSSLTFSSVKLKKGEAAYSIVSTMPSVTPGPAIIKAGDSLVIAISYTPKDSLRHQDTILITNGCFTVPVALDAHTSTGIISAEDITYGKITVKNELCKTLLIQNTGSAAFTLLPSPALTDNVDFAIDQPFLARLPLQLPPGGKVSVTVCFHPQQAGDTSAKITWATDISSEFTNSGKNYSLLNGSGSDPFSVHSTAGLPASFSVRPNPASGNSAVVSFMLPGKDKASLTIYDLLGREVMNTNLHQGSGEIEIPIGYLPRGVYQVRITSDDMVFRQKLEVVR